LSGKSAVTTSWNYRQKWRVLAPRESASNPNAPEHRKNRHKRPGIENLIPVRKGFFGTLLVVGRNRLEHWGWATDVSAFTYCIDAKLGCLGLGLVRGMV